MTGLRQTTAILSDLVALPTVSSESNLELIAYAAQRLGECGANISMTTDKSGHKANLFATIGPDRDGGIVLSGHTDVVPALAEEWTSPPFELRQANGRLYGRGTCDMKGFIAAALATAPRYAKADLQRPVHFAFTYDEEVGCLGARQLVDELERMNLRPAAAIVGEPTGMAIIDGHKGCFEYTTVFTGLEGHGSDPDAGVNAVEYAARYLARLMELAEELKQSASAGSRFAPPWTTIQAGYIQGGTARNVIAGHCRIEWEMRPVAAQDASHVKAALATFCETELLPAMQAANASCGIVTETIGEVEGLTPMDDNQARHIVTELTGANGTELAAFGTEAGLYQKLGISTVVCGPGLIEQAHKPDEYVSLDQLQTCLDMLAGLERKLTA